VDLYKILTLIILTVSCSAPRPNNLGIVDSKLLSCPDKPNCISSFASVKSEHYADAIKIVSNKERAHQKVSGILDKSKNAKIISSTADYIHAEYTSSIFKFVDDVEFYLGIDKLVHFRSASRTGKSDLGVNKKRIEEIRFKFQQNDF
jgi:uncharacterized protein (DUF1499 family)